MVLPTLYHEGNMKVTFYVGLIAAVANHSVAHAAENAQPEETVESAATGTSGTTETVQDGGSATIVVTATRTGAPLAQLPVSATVINEQELEKQLEYSSNILRAIEFAAPGVSPQGEGRVGCFVGIRGRQTSIQINGIPVNQDLRQSNCNAMFQVSPFAIQRIEVVRGGTALFGAGAPGGIVNFITRRAKSSRLEVDAVAQTSFNTSDWDDTFTHDLYLGAGQDLGAWDYYLGGGYTNTGARRTPDGGFVPFRTYESLALNGAVGGDLLKGEIRATGTYYRETPGREFAADGTQVFGERFANVIPIASHPQIDEASDRLATLALSYHHPQLLAHELNLSLFFQDQRYRQRDNFFDVNFGGDFFFATNTENQRLGVRSTLVKRFEPARLPTTLSYGFDYTRNRFYRPTVDPAAGGVITGFISPEVVLDTYALFSQAEVDLDRLRLTGGVRHEWYRGEVGDEGFDPDIASAGVPGNFGKSDLTLFN
ncbi:MAG: TonB-dependent receptor plug domain-containing protein, partial [Sphingomonas sp.]|nr:TonB-dependent receptor plug domain-containing protein [Sphingomonas sp.]